MLLSLVPFALLATFLLLHSLTSIATRLLLLTAVLVVVVLRLHGAEHAAVRAAVTHRREAGLVLLEREAGGVHSALGPGGCRGSRVMLALRVLHQ